MRVNKRARRNVLSVHVPLCWSINESLTNKVIRNWFTECRLASVNLFRYYLNNHRRYIFTDFLKKNLNFRVIQIVELSVARNVVQIFEYWLFLGNIDRSRESSFCFSDDRWRLIFLIIFWEEKQKFASNINLAICILYLVLYMSEDILKLSLRRRTGDCG